MDIEQSIYNQIATTLSKHYDSVFYVDLETGAYKAFVPTTYFKELNIPEEGEDFFAMSRENAASYVPPSELDLVLQIHDRETIKDCLLRNGSYAVSSRIVV